MESVNKIFFEFQTDQAAHELVEVTRCRSVGPDFLRNDPIQHSCMTKVKSFPIVMFNFEGTY